MPPKDGVAPDPAPNEKPPADGAPKPGACPCGCCCPNGTPNEVEGIGAGAGAAEAAPKEKAAGGADSEGAGAPPKEKLGVLAGVPPKAGAGAPDPKAAGGAPNEVGGALDPNEGVAEEGGRLPEGMDPNSGTAAGVLPSKAGADAVNGVLEAAGAVPAAEPVDAAPKANVAAVEVVPNGLLPAPAAACWATSLESLVPVAPLAGTDARAEPNAEIEATASLPRAGAALPPKAGPVVPVLPKAGVEAPKIDEPPLAGVVAAVLAAPKLKAGEEAGEEAAAPNEKTGADAAAVASDAAGSRALAEDPAPKLKVGAAAGWLAEENSPVADLVPAAKDPPNAPADAKDKVEAGAVLDVGTERPPPCEASLMASAAAAVALDAWA
mmetsp:Transcript_34551/g.97905  ORF Transcript_34551/g.97905 Transcript_34551/m.97905 type:complete len:380 (-) Transcript_34551:1599-2738(-)